MHVCTYYLSKTYSKCYKALEQWIRFFFFCVHGEVSFFSRAETTKEKLKHSTLAYFLKNDLNAFIQW